jgi:hypothetical protein
MRTAALAVTLVTVFAAGTAQDPDRAFIGTLLARYSPQPVGFQFGLIGDQQYSAEEEARFPDVLAAMNREPLAFVVHDGDFKGGAPCTDALFRSRYAVFDTSAHPFVFTPGDNDWTDCHRDDNGGFDPLERLDFLRRLFYAQPDRSIGRRTMPVTSQTTQRGFATYRENALWTLGDVVFATLHLVGSGNGTGRTAAGDAEARDRTRAAIAWTRTAFALGEQGGFRAVMLIAQANPRFDLAATAPAHRPFAEWTRILEAETRRFRGQVVLVHGDTHYFRIDKPLPMPAAPRSSGGPSLVNFTRVETFGPPDLHWIRARVVPGSRGVFVFEPELLP